MLKRLYVDNYKSFVNFEYRPGKRELLLGDNGAGKSSVFEVIASLRALIIDGIDVAQAFPKSTETRWLHEDRQGIEIEVEGNAGLYRYTITLIHTQNNPVAIIENEALTFDGENLLLAVSNFKIRTHSSLYFLAQSNLNNVLNWFIEWIRSIIIVRIDPYRMAPSTEQDIDHPSITFDNYASWYRHLVQENASVIADMTRMLQEVISGFETLNLQKAGEQTRVLKVLMSSDSLKGKYSFDELSEGQRTLIALYTIIAVLGDKPGLLCIDEPDNYVSLKEIQPWLLKIEDLIECADVQVLIISHHPEIINFLAPSAAKLFYRIQNGPVRVKAFEVNESNEGLFPAEIVARGWEND